MPRLAPSGDALQFDPSENTRRGLDSRTESVVLTCLLAGCLVHGDVGNAQHPPNRKVSMTFTDETSDIFCFDILLETIKLSSYALADVELEVVSAWGLEFRVRPGQHSCLETMQMTTRRRLTVL